MMFFREAHAALVCYDLADPVSFQKVSFWISQLLEKEPTCAVYVVGNKGSFVRAFDRSIGRAWLELYLSASQPH